MRASIVIIGDEILMGQVTDTNSGEIARRLGPLGWQVVETIVTADTADSIRSAVDRALDRADLVITTGGLGPTKDDITKHVLAGYFGDGSMHTDEQVSANIARVFAARGLQLNELTRRQALVPDCCRVIQNELGTAPIMWFERPGKVLVAMPGVPFETVGMLDRVVIGEIARRFTHDIDVRHHTLIVTGITESALAERLSAWESALPSCLHLAYLPEGGYIRLRLDQTLPAGSPSLIEDAAAGLRSMLADVLAHDGDATPAQILLGHLRRLGLTVATAESCTGGNIAHQITSVPGSSESYMGGVVSYSNSVKTRVLGVDAADIDRYGAVSEAVVLQMARGAAALCGADCAMATSGIAGPGGAVPGKPVGTVWIAVHTPSGTRAVMRRFPGDRSRVIDRATTTALLMLAEALRQPATLPSCQG